MVKIVCDSTADLTPDVVQKYGISIVPLNIHFGLDSLQDKIDITADAFYKRLTTDTNHPTTSAPAPGLFADIYQELAKETDEILVLTISGGISATYESAVQAKAMVGDICKIEVIDTLLTVGGEFIAVLRAAQAAQQGAKLTEICSMVKDILPRIHCYGMFDTLEYLQKGGRIGRVQAFVGSMLKFHPIITLKDGLVTPAGRTRSKSQGIEFLTNRVKEANGIEEMVIQDATTPADLESFADKLSDFYPKEKMYRTKVGPVIGTHVGPSVLFVCYMETK